MNKQKLSFKWFGSLSKLSIHHSSDKAKAKSKSTLKHHGSVSEASAGGKPTNDTDGCLLSPGHAHSSDTCSHLATMPRRSLKNKKSKGPKKTVGNPTAERQQAGDYVRESPLLSVLCSQSISTLHMPSLLGAEAKPHHTDTSQSQPGQTQRLEPGVGDVSTALLLGTTPREPQRKVLPAEHHEIQDQARTLTTCSVDTGAIMSAPSLTSALTSETREHQQDQEAEPVKSNLTMDSRGEYVKFSREKYLPECPPETLRKELEEELKGSSEDLSSHGWYHGNMPREVSETLVLRNGDFLIRASLTSVGDYVLTCRWDAKVLHFVIVKLQVESIDLCLRVQYLLGRESFESVAALVHFYVGSQKALSQESGAHIYRPINRTLPLRHLEASFAWSQGKKVPVHSPSSVGGMYIKRRSVVIEEGPNTWMAAPHSMSDSRETWNSSHKQNSLSPSYSSETHHWRSTSSRKPDVVSPLPVPFHKTDLDASQEPHFNFGSSLKMCKPRPFPMVLPTLGGHETHGHIMGGQQNGNGTYTVPMVDSESCFRPSSYMSQLMPEENRPLEAGLLKRVKELLTEMDARTAAQHLTKADCSVARILNNSDDMQQKMAVNSGLELLTLPQGHQLRLDLLERFHTMSIMIAAELLGCTGSREERAAILLKTILLAAELKSHMGNMFGFAAIMRALELPQISRLEQTWTALRQRHTEGAVLYEKKLKPYLNSMNAGKEGCMLTDTTFPHVVPLLFLLERGVAVNEGAEPWESSDMGVDVVMSHLEAARLVAHHGEVFCRNAETKLQGFHERPDMMEVFLTEFQMRLLWGNRGCETGQAERYQKFDKVLTALSNKLEPPGGHRMERT